MSVVDAASPISLIKQIKALHDERTKLLAAPRADMKEFVAKVDAANAAIAKALMFEIVTFNVYPVWYVSSGGYYCTHGVMTFSGVIVMSRQDFALLFGNVDLKEELPASGVHENFFVNTPLRCVSDKGHDWHGYMGGAHTDQRYVSFRILEPSDSYGGPWRDGSPRCAGLKMTDLTNVTRAYFRKKGFGCLNVDACQSAPTNDPRVGGDLLIPLSTYYTVSAIVSR